MTIFKVVINDTKNKRSSQIEVDQSKAVGIIGKKIGDQFNGDILDLVGYILEITGGTDKDGFPMYPGLNGSGRKKMLLSGKPGFKPWIKGQRKRKTVRGNTISEAIVQINAKITKVGEKTLEQLIPKKAKEAPKEEKTAEKPKAVEKKPEPKKEKQEKPEPEKKAGPKEEKKEDKKQETPVEKPKEQPKKEEKTGGVESKDKNQVPGQ